MTEAYYFFSGSDEVQASATLAGIIETESHALVRMRTKRSCPREAERISPSPLGSIRPCTTRMSFCSKDSHSGAQLALASWLHELSIHRLRISRRWQDQSCQSSGGHLLKCSNSLAIRTSMSIQPTQQPRESFPLGIQNAGIEPASLEAGRHLGDGAGPLT